MRNYKVLTRVSGLRRADGERKPIDIEEVIALPDDVADGLERIQAIELTDDEVTCDLEWDDHGDLDREHVDPVSGIPLVSVMDRAGLAKALADLDGTLIMSGHVYDRASLIAAALPFGGEVLFPGEQLGHVAARLSNAELVSELSGRVQSGSLPRWELPGTLGGFPDSSDQVDGQAAVIEVDHGAAAGDMTATSEPVAAAEEKAAPAAKKTSAKSKPAAR